VSCCVCNVKGMSKLRYMSERCESVPQDLFVTYRSLFFYACLLEVLAVIIHNIYNEMRDEERGL